MADFQTVNLAQIYGAADDAIARRQQTQMLQSQYARQQKQDAENDAVKGAYVFTPEGGLDEKATLANLYRVAPSKAYEQQQAFTTRDQATAKMKREENSARLADADKKIELLGKAAKNVLAAPTLDNAIATTTKYGQLTGEDVSQELSNLQSIGNNPEAIRRWAAGHALSAEQMLPKTQMQDTGGASNVLSIDPLTGKPTVISSTNKTATPGEIMSNGIARANLGVAQGNLAVNQGRLAVEKAGGKAPAGYRYNPDGSLTAIPGGPGDKTLSPTEVQGKAALFSQRAGEADKILNSVAGDYSPMGINAKNAADNIPLIGGLTGLAGNKLLSDKSQQADQAQRNFVNAVLRQESGAAISASEFDNARKQYFPQPGDSKTVIQQKANNRKTAIQGLNSMAGPLGKKNQTTTDTIPAGWTVKAH